MTTLESILLSFLANALWQIPLLFVAGLLAVRTVRSLGPGAEHKVWVGVLLLQVFLPMVSTIPLDALRTFLGLMARPLDDPQAQVSVLMGPGKVLGDRHLPAWLLSALFITYGITIAWFTVRFAWRIHRLSRLKASASLVVWPNQITSIWTEYADRFDVKGASLATSPLATGPITLGIRHKLVLFPADLLHALTEAELRTALAHEFAHMRRHDFFKNLLYELICVPVSFHPILSLNRFHVVETREMVCDQMAASMADREQYARSLLRLASRVVNAIPSRTPHAIGIFDTTTFERRIMRLTKTPTRPSGLKRAAAITGSALLGSGICCTTLALAVHVDAFASGEEQHSLSSAKGPIHVSSDVMQAQILRKTPPVYPDDAKKKRIQGKVELDAVIGTTGDVEQLDVVSGPKELQQSALDAVRQWVYKPFLLNGEPVEVKTTIHVTYSLSDSKTSHPSKK